MTDSRSQCTEDVQISYAKIRIKNTQRDLQKYNGKEKWIQRHVKFVRLALLKICKQNPIGMNKKTKYWINRTENAVCNDFDG